MIYKLALAFEAVSFVASLLLYTRKQVPLYLKYFPFFLFITVIIEAAGNVMRLKRVNSWPMYNYFTISEFIFYFFVLYQLIRAAHVRKIVLLGMALYPVIAVTYILLNDEHNFHSLTYMLGALLLVGFCGYYFYELFDNPVFKLMVEPAFWISYGLLFYYSCTMPLIVFINYLNPSEIEAKTYGLILFISNYLLYSFFIVAFFCFLRLKKTDDSDT